MVKLPPAALPSGLTAGVLFWLGSLPPLRGKGGDEQRPAEGGPYAIAKGLAIAQGTPQRSCGWAHRSPLCGRRSWRGG
jgi:hypothetical protein